MSAPLTFHLLGGATIARGDDPLTDFRSRTAEALLIYLVCHDRPLARQFLADFFWDERSQKQASANLRAVLSMLRKQVGGFILADRQTVAFDHTADYWLDSAEFERQMRALTAALNQPGPLTGETVRQLEAALALYEGDFLAGFHLNESRGFEEWVIVRREQLRRLAVPGLGRMGQHLLENGRYQQGIAYSERLAAADPYNEEAQRQLMWLLIRSGWRNAALQSYQTFKALLEQDLGVDPAPATTAVYEKISSLAFPPADNLSLSPTPFIGREEEIEALLADIFQAENRLITIVGPGGVGKTTLALQFASRLKSFRPGYFLDGIWFVSLASLLSTRFLVTAVANTLNVTFRGTAAPRTQLLNFLRDRELLLILDNFEQLLVGEESGPALLDDILAQAPQVKILVTSREQLNMRQALIYDLAGLPYPTEPDVSPESAVQYQSLALFLQNARRVSRRFDPSEADIQAIGRICRLLEGMPLGLEMAAAWVRQDSVAQIASRLEQSLGTLATSWRDVPERHQSLQSVFDHSWQLLTAKEQSGFTRLAVFQGGFTPEAALAVAEVAKPSIFQGKSLLRSEGGISARNSDRFSMHSLIHQFTAEILRREESSYQTVQHNHAHYYLSLLGRQASLLIGDSAEDSLNLIALEIENIRRAWQWAVEQGQLELLNEGYLSLYQFYEMRGWLDEGKNHFSQTVAALGEQLGPVEQLSEQAALVFGRLMGRQGWFIYRTGQLALATEILEKCEAIFRRLEARKELAQSLSDQGLLARRNGDYVRAKDLCLESLHLRREINDRRGVAMSLINLANAVRYLGEYETAQAYLLESLDFLLEEGNLLLLANVYNDLGETCRATGNYQEARKYHESSLSIRRQIDNRLGIAMCLNNLGSIAHTLGDHESARRYAQESLAIDIEAADKRAMPYPLSILGRIARDEGDFAASFAAFRRALQICGEINYVPKSLDILFELATVLEAMKRPQPAIPLLAFVIHHPKINHETKKAAEALLNDLAAQLPPETAAELEQNGRNATLETIIRTVLSRELE